MIYTLPSHRLEGVVQLIVNRVHAFRDREGRHPSGAEMRSLMNQTLGGFGIVTAACLAHHRSLIGKKMSERRKHKHELQGVVIGT